MVKDKGFKYVYDKLIANGFKAYLVGGAVRDYLLKRKCYDLDVATSALPEQILAVFETEKKVLTGLKHGTVGIIVYGKNYEVTTFRQDGEYNDFRHPSDVNFVSDLKTDLSRRDFTINAMAYSETEGVIDYFNGQEDLKNKLIRCVFNPYDRFKEDALRLMRALRFSSQLSFAVESKTAQAILDEKNLINNIAVERILTELFKLLCGNNVFDVLMKFKDFFAEIIPELKPCFGFDQKSVFHSFDVYEHIIKSVSLAKKDKTVRLALLLHDIGKPECFTVDDLGRGHFYGHPKKSVEIAKNVLKRLKVDKETYFTVIKLIERHDDVLEENSVAVKKALRDLGEKKFLLLLDLQEADAKAHSKRAIHKRLKHILALRSILASVKRENKCYSLKKLAVNGTDLREKFSDGKDVGEALNYLLDAVIEEKVKNEKGELLNYLDERIRK